MAPANGELSNEPDRSIEDFEELNGIFEKSLRFGGTVLSAGTWKNWPADLDE